MRSAGAVSIFSWKLQGFTNFQFGFFRKFPFKSMSRLKFLLLLEKLHHLNF